MISSRKEKREERLAKMELKSPPKEAASRRCLEKLREAREKLRLPDQELRSAQHPRSQINRDPLFGEHKHLKQPIDQPNPSPFPLPLSQIPVKENSEYQTWTLTLVIRI